MPDTCLNDAELWSLVAQDDYRAFVQLFDRHWPALYKTCHHYLKDAAAAEETVHDLFLNLWNRRKHLVIGDFSSYLKAAARYQLYAYIKKNKPASSLSKDAYAPAGMEYELNAAPGMMLYKELEERLHRHLSSLPARCREIFLLSRIHAFSNGEIAEKLGISKRTVENQITCALQSIRYNLPDIILSLLLLTVLYR